MAKLLYSNKLYWIKSEFTWERPIIKRIIKSPIIEFKLAIGAVNIVATDDTNVDTPITHSPPNLRADHPPRT